MTATFDFQAYVDQQRSHNSSDNGFGAYAYSGDVRVLRTLSYARPVRVASEASVRAFKAWMHSDILGSAVRLGPRQFPRLHELTAECARKLHIPMPTVYVTQNFGSLNASTYGTEADSYIIINAATVDRLSDEELLFVIGHECGHIHNSHVTYRTALDFLTNLTAAVRWAITPAKVALNSWSRRAEVTCDRAGLICCGDLDVATSTMVKLAGGSKRLLEEIDVETYLAQLEDLRKGIGRISEYWHRHPYLPKRLRALQLFAESEYFQRQLGNTGGRSLSDVDADVDAVISVL